ncbi:hypothetical protein [Methanosarcina sp. DH2]|uniref:hypothetical protein n=1 Tax=Methanosarcina sp. DH2 TaxID=2605639 RepID=UPI001E57E855|nr:hypothetical protein [Methanosarcina sp. DH2]
MSSFLFLSDFTASKKRRAIVIADLKGEDLILCQITSAVRNDEYAVPLTNPDFEEGSFPTEKSSIHTNKVFTADLYC